MAKGEKARTQGSLLLIRFLNTHTLRRDSDRQRLAPSLCCEARSHLLAEMKYVWMEIRLHPISKQILYTRIFQWLNGCVMDDTEHDFYLPGPLWQDLHARLKPRKYVSFLTLKCSGMCLCWLCYICSTQTINEIKKQVVKVTHNPSPRNDQLQLEVLYMNTHTYSYNK